MSQLDEQPAHRLFAAIVLMGSNLAFGCGGMSESDRHVGGGGPTNVSNGGSGGGTSSGNGASAGTDATTTPGGATTTTGGMPINIGLPDPVPEAVEPGPFACPPQQWSCASTLCDYSYSGWSLPEACACDPKRPRDAGDCAAGEVFVCQKVTSNGDGRPFTKPVKLSCSCVEKTMSFCNAECNAAFGNRDLRCEGSDDELSALCGCAIPYLK